MYTPSVTGPFPLIRAIAFGPVLFFLIGSIPFGYLVGRLKGVDLRKQGSGNIGATNVGRVLGKKCAALVFALDFLKGFLPLFLLNHTIYGWVWRKIIEPYGWFQLNIYNWPDTPLLMQLMIVLGLLLVIGHDYTPWLRFKGGKGIATSAGVLAFLTPAVLAVSLTAWIILVAVTRVISIASLAACVALPLASLLFYPGQKALFVFTFLLGLLGIWRHRGNIARLRLGTEPRWGKTA